MQHVFIVGSKGIPGAYGGYETFVDKLTEYHQDHPELRYHVACKGTRSSETEYHNARCFTLKVPNIGPAQAIWYDVAALSACCRYIRDHGIENAIVYILACRIGPFMGHFVRRLHKLGAKVFLNPDGHEWLRGKWSAPIRKYWKISESLMVKHADLVICDSQNIERYILENYKKYSPATIFIAYGAETYPGQPEDDDKLLGWYRNTGLCKGAYYLAVGRFVPENNYETMIREFMRSNTDRAFAIITTADERFLERLEQRLHFRQDPRIRFVGTVYDPELLLKIRRNACGYFHGHEVGGTNPSLLEALGATKVNMLLDVGFNREVGLDSTLYWTKEEGSLARLIEQVDGLTGEQIDQLDIASRERIQSAYSWEYISGRYAQVFLNRQELAL